MASSFSRKAANPNDGKSKKLVLCGILGLVLVGLVIHQFGGAKSTEASPAGDNNQTPGVEIPTDTPASVLAALEDKSSGRNAASAAKGLAALDIAPPDPFRFSDKWLSKLSHPVAAVPQAPVKEYVPEKPPVVVHTPTPVPEKTEPKVEPSKWEPSGLKLAGIYREGDKTMAFINGSVVSEGSVIAGAKIVEVTKDYVTVQQAGNEKGQLFKLTIRLVKAGS
jgi:hypothetical protein